MLSPDIPGRIFLDTSVVNFILDYGEQIHDGMLIPGNLSDRIVSDINAFYNIFLTGQRAMWQLAVSSHTYEEVIKTPDPKRLHYLENWFFEIWHYWCSIIEDSNDLPSVREIQARRVELLASGVLEILPDLEDRILLCDAILYQCDCFCTRDWRTILKYRYKLNTLPIHILNPSELWARIKPHAALWV
jgi:hypothetical protein